MTDNLPPYAALLAHRVEDVDRWKAGFDDHEPARRAAGILGHHINRAKDDPHLITLFLPLSDLDQAKAFAASPELGEVMQKVGVVSRPEIQWLQPVRQEVVSHRQLPAFLLRHQVADFDTWLAGYDAAGELQQSAGIIGHGGEPLARRSIFDHRLPPGRDLRRVAQLPRRPAAAHRDARSRRDLRARGDLPHRRLGEDLLNPPQVAACRGASTHTLIDRAIGSNGAPDAVELTVIGDGISVYCMASAEIRPGGSLRRHRRLRRPRRGPRHLRHGSAPVTGTAPASPTSATAASPWSKWSVAGPTKSCSTRWTTSTGRRAPKI